MSFSSAVITSNESAHDDSPAPDDVQVILRNAKWSDLVAAAKMLGLAFFDTNILGDFMHPGRFKYPEDMYLYWLRRLQIVWWDPRISVMLLTEVGPESLSDKLVVNSGPKRPDRERIVGVALWTRRGIDLSAKERWDAKWWDPRPKVSRYIYLIYVKISAYFFPSRAMDPEKADALTKTWKYIGHHWSGARSSALHLNWLGVVPDRQNKGYGRKLVQWGLDRAREEGVSASVIAVDGKLEWYQHRGFDVCVGLSSEGEGNPLSGIPGGEILFLDPKVKPED